MEMLCTFVTWNTCWRIPAEGIERWVALPGSSTNTGSHDHVSLLVEGAAPAGSEPFT